MLRFTASGVGFTTSVMVSCFVLVRFIPSVVVYSWCCGLLLVLWFPCFALMRFTASVVVYSWCCGLLLVLWFTPGVVVYC